MKVSFLNGPSLANKLRDLALSCTQLDVAMAYVKIGGLNTLLKSVDILIEKSVPMRFVIGLSSKHGITDKESAEHLLKLSRRKSVTVKKWDNSGFHPKLFIFHGPNRSVVVGSSNLTHAAHSSNAEANILVEEANPQLFKEVMDFFEYYFNPAPNIQKKDVNKYKPREPHRRTKHSRRLEEDVLPQPPQRKQGLEDLRPKKIWKIAPGEDARYWNDWLKYIDDEGDGIVAIGWDIGDLNNFTSYEALKEKISRKARDDWNKKRDRRINVEYVADQLWTFKNRISAGDVFIVYSECRVFGVATMTPKSKYEYRGVDLLYEHQINVRYVFWKEWPKRADDRIVKTLGKQGTLKLVEEGWLWNYLLRKMQ